MDSAADTPCGVGCPIRRSRAQSLLAAPPGFSQRATSFIASWRQGIHQMPLLSSTHPSDNRTTPRKGQGAAIAAVGDEATTYKKHSHAFLTHAPDGRRRACVHACQRPLAHDARMPKDRPPCPRTGCHHHFTMSKI